jgi:hypothetical protein
LLLAAFAARLVVDGNPVSVAEGGGSVSGFETPVRVS